VVRPPRRGFKREQSERSSPEGERGFKLGARYTAKRRALKKGKNREEELSPQVAKNEPSRLEQRFSVRGREGLFQLYDEGGNSAERKNYPFFVHARKSAAQP